MTLKEQEIKNLREIGDRLMIGCLCHTMTCTKMADEVENDTEIGRDHMKVIEAYNDWKPND